MHTLTMPDNGRFLEAADRIGARLCRDAIWAESACNWLGPVVIGDPARPAVIYRAGGPDLYGGTSGIALFLGQLYVLTGEPIYRHTALGAIRQALTHHAHVPLAQRWGFYAGSSGIAYAAQRVAEWCDYPAGAEAALRLSAALAAGDDRPVEADVIAGGAGAIPALLWLYGRQRQAWLLDVAVCLGIHLLDTAYRQAIGWSWATIPTPADHNLTGFAHGAAGIAWALLELWRVSGETDFRRAAEYGFAYERHWFDSQVGNWPDFRHQPAGPSDSANRPAWSYGCAWCHGAPGGALARLRTAQITGAPVYRQEAETALTTTIRFLAAAPAPGAENYSLCHGLAGNADILLTAAAVLNDAQYLAQAEAVGQKGIAEVQEALLPWPCGVPGGDESPGLLLGLAGIGYFYLRLYDPARVPSVLLIPV